MSSRPLIIGHRGASAVAPENTLAAFSRAMQDGADGIEFDVRLAVDGVAVVIHDATLRRTGLISGTVSLLSSAQLNRTDVGSWFERQTRSVPARLSNQTVPTLQQVFDLFSGNQGLLYLEMKGGPGNREALAQQVVKSIQVNGLNDRVVVESFDLSAIEVVKRIDPNIRTAALFEPKISRPASFARSRLSQRAIQKGADEIALHHSLASRATVSAAKELGLNVVVWTVDDPKWVAKAQALSIDALITNNPAKMLAQRRDSGPV